MQMQVLVILVCVCECVLGAVDTGYPAGLMADLFVARSINSSAYSDRLYTSVAPYEGPAMNRSTVISEETKRSLYVVLVYPSDSILGHSEAKCQLSAAGAACVARNLDFKNRNTQVIISGYMDTTFSVLTRSLVSPYLTRGRNVILVELFPILVRTYPVAARITKPLGELVGEFLAALSRLGLSHNRLELLGGSLGAHVASFACVKYRQLTGRQPARLTGLDPAGPCFRNLPPSERFNPGAATKVDVLHTNIDGFGIAEPIGHIDFYANGGEYQPSMAGNFILPCFLLCSHVRAAKYWILAYSNPGKFVAVRCKSITDARHGRCYDTNITSNVLGPNTNFNQPGIYYLPTREKSPYYLGAEGLKKTQYGVNTYLLKPSPDEDIII